MNAIDRRNIAYNISNSIGECGLPYAHLTKKTLAWYEALGLIARVGGDYTVTDTGRDFIAAASECRV